jgi:AmiR/NasT family two-component response regulator
VTGSVSRAAAANEAVIEVATGILMARRGCTSDEAYALLCDAAQGHDLHVVDLAECLVADQELR